ncbi:DUF2304 domain-containing protein, partial [Candidatus Woesearchaeota archaeon CG_4_10_14_0_8_um_filter_47_5]
MQMIQIMAILFALFATSRVILRLRDRKLSTREFIFWMFLWLSVILFAFAPTLPQLFSEFFGIGRPVDLVIYLSILLLFYLMFRLYVRIDQLEQNITKL